MASIKAAQIAREAKILDTRVNYEGLGIMTRREFVDAGRRAGAKIRVDRERQYDKEEKLDSDLRRQAQYVAFGNPNLPETQRYNELRAKLKAGIYKERIMLEFPSGQSWELTKTELDYLQGGL